MKRFIDIGCQTGNTDEGVKEFCFFDTVRDVFEVFSGESCFTSKKEFIEYFDGDDLERYLGLIPEDWNEKTVVDWKDVTISLFGKEIKGITSINFSEVKEMGSWDDFYKTFNILPSKIN